MTFISGSGLSSELQIQIPITLWTEAVADFIFLGSKITVDGDCSQEIKRCLLLGRKAMTNLNSVLKNRDITLPTKVHGQCYGFFSSHVWLWELDHKEGWAPKNWCFWIVVLEKTPEFLGLQGNQTSQGKDINLECSLERLVMKLKLQCFSYLIQKAVSLEKTWCWERSKAKGEGGGRGWDG